MCPFSSVFDLNFVGIGEIPVDCVVCGEFGGCFALHPLPGRHPPGAAAPHTSVHSQGPQVTGWGEQVREKERDFLRGTSMIETGFAFLSDLNLWYGLKNRTGMLISLYSRKESSGRGLTTSMLSVGGTTWVS